MSRPWKALRSIEHRYVGRGAAIRDDEVGERPVGVLRNEIAAQLVRFGNGRGETHAGQVRRKRKEPREPKRKQVSALGNYQGMQFVEHHASERAKEEGRVW